MNTSVLLIAELFRKYNLVNDLQLWINENKHRIFGHPYYDNLTFNQWLEIIEDDKKQRTVVLSNRFSYDGVKYYFATQANKLLSTIQEHNIRVVDVKNIKDEEFLTQSFDLVIELDGKKIPFEIKFTQSNTTFSGSTHSTNKVKNYMFIFFEVYRDVVISSTKQLVKNVFMMVDSFEMENWVGEAKDNSSFSRLKLSSKRDYTNKVIKGSLKFNKVWCTMIGESV
jgi:hypothetical protein